MEFLAFTPVVLDNWVVVKNGIARDRWGGTFHGEPWEEAIQTGIYLAEGKRFKIYFVAPVEFSLTPRGWDAMSVRILAGPWGPDDDPPRDAAAMVLTSYKNGDRQLGRVLAWALSLWAGFAKGEEKKIALLLKDNQEKQAPQPQEEQKAPPLEDLERTIYGHPDPQARIAALRFLPQYGEAAILPLEHIISGAIRAPEVVRAQAARTLGAFGEAAIPTLERLLQNRRDLIIPELLEAAAEIGKPASRAIKLGLSGMYIKMQLAAISAAARIGDLALLEEALQIPDVRIWAAVMEAAGMIGYWPIVQRGLDDKAVMVRAAAIRAAACFGSEIALPILEAAINEESKEIRVAAAEAAERVGPAALPIVERGVEDPEFLVRRRSVEAASKMGDQALRVLERVALSDSDPFLRRLAYFAAVKASSDADQVVSFLAKGLLDSDPFTKEYIVRLAADVGRPAASIIFTGLKSPAKSMRREAYKALDLGKVSKAFLEAVNRQEINPFTALLARIIYENNVPLPVLPFQEEMQILERREDDE